jgi:hypothetical protein
MSHRHSGHVGNAGCDDEYENRDARGKFEREMESEKKELERVLYPHPTRDRIGNAITGALTGAILGGLIGGISRIVTELSLGDNPFYMDNFEFSFVKYGALIGSGLLGLLGSTMTERKEEEDGDRAKYEHLKRYLEA